MVFHMPFIARWYDEKGELCFVFHSYGQERDIKTFAHLKTEKKKYAEGPSIQKSMDVYR